MKYIYIYIHTSISYIYSLFYWNTLYFFYWKHTHTGALGRKTKPFESSNGDEWSKGKADHNIDPFSNNVEIHRECDFYPVEGLHRFRVHIIQVGAGELCSLKNDFV